MLLPLGEKSSPSARQQKKAATGSAILPDASSISVKIDTSFSLRGATYQETTGSFFILHGN